MIDESIVKFFNDYNFEYLDEWQHLTKDDIYELFKSFNEEFDDKFDPTNHSHVNKFIYFLMDFARVDT